MTDKIQIGVLGATGMAGREAIQKIINLEYAELALVTGSPSSAGEKYGKIFKEKEEALSRSYEFWEPQKCPERYRELEVRETDPEVIVEEADYVISALPSSVAEDVEPEIRENGVSVFSNSSTYRWKQNVPLLIPEINHKHIEHVENQEQSGKQANNPNCTTAGYVPVIGILEDQGLGIKSVDLVTMQSISGKGDKISNEDYSGWISGNVIDDWSPEERFNGEEQKSEIEPQKILGRHTDRESVVAEFTDFRENGPSEDLDILPISAETRRVPTQYGHLESVKITFEEEISVEDFEEALESWSITGKVGRLPTTPENLVEVREQVEPVNDVFAGEGMTLVVGDARKLGPKEIGFVSLSHNLRRGATWTAIQSMELYLQEIEDYSF